MGRFASLSRKWWFWLACLTVLGLLIGLGLWINWLTQTAITIDVSGNVRHVHTRAETVSEALDEADILIDPEDTIEPEPATRLKDGMTIRVHKAAVVVIEAAGRVFPVRTVQSNPLTILAEQQINVGPYDVLRVDGQDFSSDQVESASWDRPPAAITLLHASAIQVIDGERTLDAHTVQPDVARALDDLGLELYLGDGISPDPSDRQKAFDEKYSLGFPLLADVDHAVAESYGVWGEKSYAGKTYMGVDRSTFVIGADGNVAKVFRQVKPAEHADQVLEALSQEAGA